MSVRPALSATEWFDYTRSDTTVEFELFTNGYRSGGKHEVAALALYGQPFGFTWEDVDRLRHFPSWLIDEMPEGFRYNDESGTPVEEWLASLADRIAALLPPREPSKVKEAR